MKFSFRQVSAYKFAFLIINVFVALLSQTVCAHDVLSGVVKTDTLPPASVPDLYVSNNGSNSNDGKTPETPKQSITSIAALLAGSQGGGPVAVSLEDNSVFREEFVPLKTVRLGSFATVKGGRLPKITGMDVFKEWTPTPAKKNVYENTVTHSIEQNIQYSYMMVAEIDTALEKINPITAVRYLTLVPGVDACESFPGTYYSPDLASNPIKVYIHATDGVPGRNRFRYEVTTRRCAIYGTNFDGVTYENLFLQTSGNGVGLLYGGDNTQIKNVTFQGGGTHHLVIKSGSIDSSLFLPGPKGLKEEIAAVFYEPEGAGNVNKISNCTFLDIRCPIYTHTNGAVNHRSLTIDRIYAFGDSTDATNAVSGSDTDTITVSNYYAENYPTGWWGNASQLSISSSIFRNTNQSGILVLQPERESSKVNISNVLIKTNGNDANQNAPNGWVAFGVRANYANISVNVSNSVIHGYSTWHQNSDPAITTFQLAGQLTAMHNIYICDVNDNNYMHIVRANNSSGLGKSTNINSDYNVFLLVRGKGFHWLVEPLNNNNESSIVTLAQWQALTGQDMHSLFIDLRNNPMGLQAVFVDPANGNWSFSPTDVAATIKNIGAGFTTPPLYYPQRPVIGPNESFSAPGGFSSFAGIDKSANESVLGWKTFKEKNIASFNLEYSTDSINFVPVDTMKALADGNDNSYQYTHQHVELAINYYRLKIIRTDQSFYYSQIVTIKRKIRDGVFLDLYPNPFQHTITVEHPARTNAVLLIYDMSGKLLRTVKIPSGIVLTRVPLSDFNKGLYIMRWSTATESISSLMLK